MLMTSDDDEDDDSADDKSKEKEKEKEREKKEASFFEWIRLLFIVHLFGC